MYQFRMWVRNKGISNNASEMPYHLYPLAQTNNLSIHRCDNKYTSSWVWDSSNTAGEWRRRIFFIKEAVLFNESRFSLAYCHLMCHNREAIKKVFKKKFAFFQIKSERVTEDNLTTNFGEKRKLFAKHAL